MSEVIHNSDPQAMADVAREIKRYAEGISGSVQKLQNRHRAMHASWSGEQYDRFTEVVQAVKSKLDKQTERLKEIAADVDKDAAALADALHIDIKR